MDLKIGLVSGEFPPMEGGVRAVTQELAKNLSALGHEIHIISSKKSRPREEHRSIWDIKEPYDLGFAQLHARMGSWRWHSLSIIARIASQYHLDVIDIQYQAAAYDMIFPAMRKRGTALHFLQYHVESDDLLGTFEEIDDIPALLAESHTGPNNIKLLGFVLL